ncbi:hypothetical protein [Mucilaginibacter pedocola]|uniref:DUF4393 domain-containing protein n=1 Tax=Mucilaginibacter pedocola TaxID=1792845 RepID=A0A1S9P6T0_9SPHI|nr:hypothetical protein [Mucilaginibacter pedocola]OOQ56655.1 hypothetical protein BC343_19720 [Mucilaginibacter pedocola]
MKKYQSKEIGISVVKSLFSAVPWVGGLLNEGFFDYWGRVKQGRLNNFTQMLAEYFSENPDIQPETIRTEDFCDLFESVVRKVLQTKSKEKHLRFRSILIHQIHHPSADAGSVEICLELIASLDEVAISILKAHLEWHNAYYPIKAEQQKVLDDLEAQGKELNELKINAAVNQMRIDELTKVYNENQEIKEAYNQNILTLQTFREANYFQLTDAEYLYYKQSLYAKGLLIDKGMGTYSGKIFYYMWLTEFGIRFLEFIVYN